MWTIIIEVGLSLLGFMFKSFGAKDDRLKWLNKISNDLHKRGWARKKFILELEQDSSDYIDKKIKDAEKLKNATEQKND